MSKSPAGRICAQLISSVEADAEFAKEFRETFVSARRTTVLGVLRRWQERGEIRADVDLEVAADLLYGPIWYRRLVQQGAADPEVFADALAGSVLTAVTAVSP